MTNRRYAHRQFTTCWWMLMIAGKLLYLKRHSAVVRGRYTSTSCRWLVCHATCCPSCAEPCSFQCRFSISCCIALTQLRGTLLKTSCQSIYVSSCTRHSITTSSAHLHAVLLQQDGETDCKEPARVVCQFAHLRLSGQQKYCNLGVVHLVSSAHVCRT